MNGNAIACGSAESLEIMPDGCPRLRVTSSLLPVSGEIALSYLEPGYRPIPPIQDDSESWIPAVNWALFQHCPPTREEIIEWQMRYPCAGMALVCGRGGGFSPPYADADFKRPEVRP